MTTFGLEQTTKGVGFVSKIMKLKQWTTVKPSNRWFKAVHFAH